MKIDPSQMLHQAECDLAAKTVTADELAGLRALRARLDLLQKEHAGKLGIQFSDSLDQQIASLFRRYHDIATDAVRETKQFNDDLLVFLRAFALVLDMAGNATTHAEKNARLRGAIELIESALAKVRDHSFGVAFCARRFSSDVFRSDYPTRQFVDRIHQLEQQQTKWHFTPELPDDEITVLVAREGGDVHEAWHADGKWWMTTASEGDQVIREKVYAWSHIPAAPAPQA